MNFADYMIIGTVLLVFGAVSLMQFFDWRDQRRWRKWYAANRDEIRERTEQ